jgi:hypothetical protein
MPKCISIKRPWAGLIVKGIKPVENRNWYTSYRGPLLIHASQSWDEDGVQWILSKFPELTDFIRHTIHRKGELIGQAELIACVKYYRSEWFFGPYGFVFANAVEFSESIPYRGRLGIFEVKI